MAFNQNQVEVIFDRPSKIYLPGDQIGGTVRISTRMDIKHEGVVLSFLGACNLQLTQKNAGIVEAIYKPVKQSDLAATSADLTGPGIYTPGVYELPFNFTLEPKPGKTLYETYHGVYVSVQYTVKITIRRTFPNKFIEKSAEFVVESAREGSSSLATTRPVTFERSPQNTVSHGRERVPRFSLVGKIDSVSCAIGEPFTGDIVIKECSARIRSIELQLMRVETCGASETGFTCDRTEVQNIQIADGDVCRNLEIPLYMIFPRLFTCPTLVTTAFKIEFEINVVVIFDTDYMVTEIVPITIHRFRKLWNGRD